MLSSETLASLITFFRTSLMKFYHNSRRMSDSFHHITESSSEFELKKGPKQMMRIKLKNKGPKHSHLAM